MSKGMFVLIAGDLFVCLWFVNGLLMFRLPDKFNGSVLWPRIHTAHESDRVTILSRKKVRLLGLFFMAASGIFALTVLLRPTVAVTAWFFRHY